MTNNPDLSLIVNTYNRPRALVECLRALLNQSCDERWSREIIVVDDGSPESPESVLREAGLLEGVSFHRIPHAGPGAARNAGVALARGRWIVFLGDDIVAGPDFVRGHAEFLDRAGAEKRMSLGRSDWNIQGRSTFFAERAQAHHFQGLESGQTLDFRRFYTANVALPKRALDEAGGFDEAFTSYGWDDTDLGYRLERAGWALIYNAAARAEHRHPMFSVRGLCRRQTELAFGGCRFYAKHQFSEAARVAFFPESRASKAGPAWRRNLGCLAAEILERMAPRSRLLEKIYVRLMVSSRALGVAQGRCAFPGAGI